MRWLVILGLVLAVAIWLWRSSNEAPEVPPVAIETPVAPRAPTLLPTVPPKERGHLSRPRQMTAFDATSQHTADPCTALVDPVIPTGFETVTAASVTVAWDPTEVSGPSDGPFRPVALAYTVAGLLEEAAQLTGTDRRPELTVIVDASPEEFTERTKPPVWVSGLYDGGAIHLSAKGNADLGVVMATLRHEVMHAQMHSGIGCTPFWFNEGLATYFAGATPARDWIAMMRGEQFDLRTIKDPAIFDLKAENVQRMYAVSLAMVVYIVHNAGETGLRQAVHIAMTSDRPLDLWELSQPNVDYRAVVESLAQRVFGTLLDANLETALRGSVCCKNLRAPAALSCRVPSPDEQVLNRRVEICRRW